MRVVHLLDRIEYSGAEIMLHQAAATFKKNDIDTTLLACYPDAGQFEQPMRDIGYKVDSVGVWSSFTLLFNLYKYFRKNKFDVIHIHYERLYMWVVIILRTTGHHNIIRTFHNNWKFAGWLRFKRLLGRKIAFWLGAKHHAIGEAVKANEERLFFNKTYIINNWIQLKPELLANRAAVTQAKRQELGISNDALVLVSVGACSPVKNHEFILNLTKALSEDGVKVCYLHVGAGWDEDIEKSTAKKLGIDGLVVFTGNRKDVPELLAAADIYLMPSSTEGLSIALLEGMYYNNLAIVNNARGLANVVLDKQTGYVIDVAEPLNYINFIKDIATNKIDTSTVKAGAKAFVEENYVVEKNATKLIEFYKLKKVNY